MELTKHLVTSNSQKSVGLKGQEEEMPSERWVMEEGLTRICIHSRMQPLPEPSQIRTVTTIVKIVIIPLEAGMRMDWKRAVEDDTGGCCNNSGAR